jgi:hypothetical protein
VILVRTVFHPTQGIPVETKIDIKGNLLRKALLDVNVATQDELFEDGGDSEEVC